MEDNTPTFRSRTLPEYQSLLGKKIECRTEDGTRHVGILQFAGINGFHGKFQVTLDRTPVWPVDRSSIRLIPDK